MARQAEIWLNPAGFLAAAASGEFSENGDTKVVTVTYGELSFAGTFDASGQLTGIETTDPLTGLPLHAAFSDYREFGEVTFPAHIAHHLGDEVVADLDVTAVDTSTTVEVSVPETVAAQ
jgi:hypothetical protein